MSYNELSETGQKIFRYAGVFQELFREDELAAVAEEENIGNELQNLINASFIQPVKQEDSAIVKYQLHPLMREFALDLIAENVQTYQVRKEEIRQLLDSLKQEEEGTLKKKLSEDKSIVQKIRAAMQYCDVQLEFEMMLEFMDCINDTINILGFWKEKIPLNRLAVKAAIALQNRNEEAWNRSRLADTLARTNHPTDLELSRKEFEKALLLFRELNNIRPILHVQYFLAGIEQILNSYSECVAMNYEGVRETCQYNMYSEIGSFLYTIGCLYGKFHLDNIFSLSKIGFKHKSWRNDFEKEDYITHHSLNVAGVFVISRFLYTEHFNPDLFRISCCKLVNGVRHRMTSPC
ncbi:MAG: hypothetical protein GY749_13645, partial [Desulfobacteraceae bacterium]|nr:hypothetical protein [Desulfobacteraceae bacterium]